jgi:hypothetical protein
MYAKFFDMGTDTETAKPIVVFANLRVHLKVSFFYYHHDIQFIFTQRCAIKYKV